MPIDDMHVLSPAAPVADVGFGVGHTRDTETKGIWIWGEPTTVKDANGERMVSPLPAGVTEGHPMLPAS